MTLSKEEKVRIVTDALVLFPTQGITESDLSDQGDAFEWCLELFHSLEKTKRINWAFGSYGLKHLVENPTGHFGVCPTIQSAYRGYVFEGTLILAAKAAGFAASGEGLKVAFNFSKSSLMAYLSSIAMSLRDPVLRSKIRGVRRYENIGCSMRPDLAAELKKVAEEKGTSVSLELRKAAEAYLVGLGRIKPLEGEDIVSSSYFDGDLYYVKESNDSITALGRSGMLNRLRQEGFSHPAPGGLISPAERALHRIQHENRVDGIPGGAE